MLGVAAAAEAEAAMVIVEQTVIKAFKRMIYAHWEHGLNAK